MFGGARAEGTFRRPDIGECPATISQMQQVSTRIGRGFGGETMYCPACGVKNRDDASECFICKKGLPASEIDISPDIVPEKSRRPGAPVPVSRSRNDAPASIGDRMLAVMVDSVLISSLTVLLAVSTSQLWQPYTTSSSYSSAREILFLSVGMLIGLIYFLLSEGIFGTTIGKSLVGAEVRKTNGDKATFKNVLIRNLFRIIDGIAFYFVGFLSALFSSRRQRLGDRFASTVVVQRPFGITVRLLSLLVFLAALAATGWSVMQINQAGGDWHRMLIGSGEAKPVSAAPASANTGMTRELAPLPPAVTGLRFVKFNLSPGVAGQTSASYRPGDSLDLVYEVSGFRSQGGSVNLDLAPSAYDPDGTVFQPLPSDALRGVLPAAVHKKQHRLTLPEFAPGGTYRAEVTAIDQAGNQRITGSAEFQVEGRPSRELRAPEIDDFQFSTTEGGMALNPPLFETGEAVHYRFKLYGLQVRDGQAEWQIAYKLYDPNGGLVTNQAEWDKNSKTFEYHPNTLFIPFQGRVSLASDAPRGLYRQEHVVTDKISGTSVTYNSQFKLKAD